MTLYFHRYTGSKKVSPSEFQYIPAEAGFFELLGNACLLCCSLKSASILIPHQHFSLFLLAECACPHDSETTLSKGAMAPMQDT